MGIRRKGREIALQTLYAIEFTDHQHTDLEHIFLGKLQEITNAKDIQADSKIYEFALEIVRNTIHRIDEIDKKIAEHSTNWKVNKIADLDKAVLRIAVYEMMFTATAPAIIMNEAIEIAKKFCSDSSSKFVNGILNSIADDLK
ncbi:MAG: transcription antitermination factor NusB [Candidatus Cloacimonas sp. 4484_143]|nr:MAG: transcription antitermination factor NusB [Candidatus Cloacimonas sp. 4484_143]RLC51217.1 MAG: transcription antitermination factor NusB [Candidatus Cloacimonadota bacterium]RLC54116.1 MAG: transcription antitermination factor NusB [Candidatus Cloacimonadota bacterium]